MKKAWIENGLIFIGPEEFVPANAEDVIDVPDDTLPENLKIVDGKLVLKSEEEKAAEKREKLLSRFMEELIRKSDFKVFNFLKKNGYRSVGDLKLYADLGYEESQRLLQKYLDFDSALWNFIYNELPSMDVNDLENFNIDSFLENLMEMEENKSGEDTVYQSM